MPSASKANGQKRPRGAPHSPTKSSPLAKSKSGAASSSRPSPRLVPDSRTASTSYYSHRNGDEAVEEEDVEPSEDDDDEDDDEEDASFAAAGQAPSFITASSGDAYLLAFSTTSKTSDNLISSHFEEPFTHQSYADALATFDSHPALDTRNDRLEEKLQSFNNKHGRWLWEMSEGFNILLYGLGSKIRVLNAFAETAQRKGNVVVVNGYDPATTQQDVLLALEEIIKEALRKAEEENEPATRARKRVKTTSPSKASPSKGKGKAPAEPVPALTLPTSLSAIESRARRFVHSLASAPRSMPDIYLVMHSLDGPTLRAPKAISILALLAAQPRLHLIASIDHLRGALLFPTSLVTTRPPHMSSLSTLEDSDSTSTSTSTSTTLFDLDVRSFTFLHYETTTRQPYTTEVHHSGLLSRVFPPSVFPPLSSSLDPSSSSLAQSTTHVLASVTDRAKRIFGLLASQQLELMEGLSTKGIHLTPSANAPSPACAITLDKFKDIATDRLYAAHNDQVDGLLAEFRDHGVVRGSMNRPAPSGEGQHEEEEDGQDGEWIWIPLARDALESVVEELGVIE